MIQIRLEDGWSINDLSRFGQPVQVFDLDGKLVGVYVPSGHTVVVPQNVTLPRPTIDPQELERRRQSKEKGFTTEEVFAHLQTLTKDEKVRAYLSAKKQEIAERGRCDTV